MDLSIIDIALCSLLLLLAGYFIPFLNNTNDFGCLRYQRMIMYYRNPDYFELDQLIKALRSVPEPTCAKLSNRLTISFGMLIGLVAAFLMILGIGHLIGGL